MDERRRTAIGALVCVWFVAAHWTCHGSESTVMLRFTIEPEDMVVLNNSYVVLNCTANSTDGSNVEISWQRNGETLVPDGRQYILSPNGSLLIPSFSQQPTDDNETYECIANLGSMALVSRWAWLQVAVLGNFSGHPQSLVVRERGNARFECIINGVPKVTITWMKNGQPLPLSERFYELPSHVLQIVNVSTSDAGNYFCQASNDFGHERTSNIARLTVHLGNEVEPMRLLSRPRDMVVEIGNTAIFECFPSHGHASIRWKREDGLPLPRNRTRISNSGNLEILRVNRSDTGNYTCEVDGVSELFGVATLLVIVPPKLVTYSRENFDGRAQMVSMECNFSGVPGPVITWLKNAKPIRSYGRILVLGQRLKIGQVADIDTALYQCWGENQAGRAGAVIPFAIKLSGFDPDPPVGVRAHAIDSKTIEITWQEPEKYPGDRKVIAHSVQYWPTLGGQENQGVESNKSSLLIGTLQPNTNYTFYVRAYNKRGASEPSEYTVQATLEDVPATAPEVRVIPVTSTSLLVTWKELPPSQSRGIIVQYKILYKRDGQLTQDITVPNDILKYHITDLETDQEYSVCVLAATKSGFQKIEESNWPWVSQVLSQSSVVEVKKLTNVKIRAVSATAVLLTWDPPEPHEIELVGFNIYYNLAGERPKLITPMLELTEFTIYGLEPDSVYEFSIAAFTDYREGELTHQTLRTPAIGYSSPGIPRSPPLITEVKAVNETAIRLSWLAPPERVTYYMIACVSATTEPGERLQEQFFNCTSTHLVMTGLRPFTEYQFTVQSHTATGPGPFSSRVMCRTEAGRPPGLLELTWFLQEPTVVQLNWKMPPYANDVVLHYVVSYCEDRFAADHPWHTHIENGTLFYTVLRDLKSRTHYQVQVHAENKIGAGPPSSIKVLTGISEPGDYGNSSDRMMGIVIGIGISGGCIIICIIIILLRNRCFPPPRGPSRAMQHTNGFTTPLRSNGFVTGPVDDKHNTNLHEPDGTTPMLNQPQEADNIEHKTELPSPKSKQLHTWRSVDSRKTGSTDKSTTLV